MIVAEPIEEAPVLLSLPAGEGGDRKPPDGPPQAASPEGEPPREVSISIERLGADHIRLRIELEGDPFVFTLDRRAARAFGARLLACAGDGYHRTQGA